MSLSRLERFFKALRGDVTQYSKKEVNEDTAWNLYKYNEGLCAGCEQHNTGVYFRETIGSISSGSVILYCQDCNNTRKIKAQSSLEELTKDRLKKDE